MKRLIFFYSILGKHWRAGAWPFSFLLQRFTFSLVCLNDISESLGVCYRQNWIDTALETYMPSPEYNWMIRNLHRNTHAQRTDSLVHVCQTDVCYLHVCSRSAFWGVFEVYNLWLVLCACFGEGYIKKVGSQLLSFNISF